jgi:hypothetical protein
VVCSAGGDEGKKTAPCSGSPRRCLAWQHSNPSRVCGCVASPRPGPDHRPTNGGHCGGDGSVLRFRALVAMTNWRGLRQPHALLGVTRQSGRRADSWYGEFGHRHPDNAAVLVASPGPPPAIGGSGRNYCAPVQSAAKLRDESETPSQYYSAQHCRPRQYSLMGCGWIKLQTSTETMQLATSRSPTRNGQSGSSRIKLSRGTADRRRALEGSGSERQKFSALLKMLRAGLM